EMIVEAAIQEDVDVIGLSILSGAHLELFPSIIEGLRKKGREDALVVAGGIIPEDDIPSLQEMGVKAIFGPGTSTEDIVRFIQKETTERSAP
ncbi:MAG TPA: cobalamin-dependent protein, partial [Dehalococcoidia bacterium]|nr:cobalamin-dependent protein [Dehalococcoidia bacterium]